jgi:NTP pyrophosphatase (non-canonical NTP hydrolase)
MSKKKVIVNRFDVEENAFDRYQKIASTTCSYRKYTPLVLTLGLCGESGEVAEKIKKSVRDGVSYSVLKEQLKLELGDVMWYISQLARRYHLRLSDIAEANLVKIDSRKSRGVIHGSGDNR